MSLYNKGEEYMLFKSVLDLIRDTLNSGQKPLHLFGTKSPDFIEDRFAQKQHLRIVPEYSNGAPDFVVTANKRVMIFDHFRIDAAEHIHSNGKDRRSKYERLLGSTRLSNIAMLERRIKWGCIIFSRDNLRTNLACSFRDHAIKEEQYNKVLDAFFSSPGKTEQKSIDKDKPREMWFFIEDISPTTDWSEVLQELDTLFQEFRNIVGVLYCHNPIPDSIPQSIEEIAFIKNKYS